MYDKVNIPAFRKEILTLLEKNKNRIEHIGSTEDGIMTAIAEEYRLELTLTDKFIGYELEINTLDGFMSCGLANDTDLYPIYGGHNEERALGIYTELIDLIQKLFAGEIYFMASKKMGKTAIKINDTLYEIHEMNKKWIGASGRIYDCNKTEFNKLQLQPLFQ